MLIYNNLCIKMINFAGIAQLVEQLTCNQSVAGSSPASGTSMAIVAKWLTHRIVAPTLVGSIPISRPINNKRV